MNLKYYLMLQLVFVLTKTEDIVTGPQNRSVFERKLCVKEVTKEDILNNHKSYYENTSDTRVLTKTVLGFLETPQALHSHSNVKSLKDAVAFSEKFSMLSPFQVEIQRIGPEKYEISGMNWLTDNDKWVDDLFKTTKRYIQVVPVIKFVNWKTSDFLALATSEKEITNLGLEVLHIAENLEVHGVILDIWSEFYGKVPTNTLILVIQEISARLRYEIRLAMLLIPPEYANEDVITKEMFETLSDFANYIIFESYDYSSAWTPGPNSPIHIIEKYVKYLTPDPLTKRNSIIMGLNFFGNKYSSTGVSKITQNEYIQILEDNEVIEFKFDEGAVEHHFEIEKENEKHLIYYPTLYFIHSRVRLVNKLGIGLAIVKLGQGLDYFYDVL